MPEISNKAGPRLDEDLKRPTRGGEDAKDPHADREHTEEPRTDKRVLERSDLATFLEPHAFPGGKRELIAVAEGNFAPEWVLTGLRALPDDGTYATVEEVWEATAF
jgi:hypothetical protein